MNTDDDTLIEVCRTTYDRIMAETGSNISAAQLACRFELQRAGFEVDEDHDNWIARMKTVFAILADDRSVHRSYDGTWYICRIKV